MVEFNFKPLIDYCRERGILPRSGRQAADAGHIPGAVKQAGMWFVPADCQWMPAPNPGRPKKPTIESILRTAEQMAAGTRPDREPPARCPRCNAPVESHLEHLAVCRPERK